MKTKSNLSAKNVFSVISKVLSWALFVILVLIAAFLLYYYIATKIYAEKGPGYEPKFSIYTIVSASMTPNINVYDAVINQKVDKPEDIKKGDVITFISTSLLTPGVTITHRVIEVTNDDEGNICYRTKGDFNNVADQACAKFNNVIGKVVLRIPQLGRIQFFLASKAGWLICILIPAFVILTKDILRITKLSTIKGTTSQMDKKNMRDLKKERLERERKAALKKKLLNQEGKSRNKYYVEPEVVIVVKKKSSTKKKKSSN